MLRLNLLYSFFHYFVTLALLIVGTLGLYEGIVNNSSKANEVIVLSFLFTLWGLFSLRRDVRLLKFRTVSYNGLNSKIVSDIFTEILKEFGWYIDYQNEDKIVATGYGIGKDKWRFFRSTKMITLLIKEDHFLINCIVEPPDSTRYSFGHNKRITLEFQNEFNKRAAIYPSVLNGKLCS